MPRTFHFRASSSPLGPLEERLLEALWDRGHATVRDLVDPAGPCHDLAYTTVMTVMNILHRKGVLHRDKRGRAWQYWPVEAREDHDARLMAEVLRSGGDENVTMRRFLDRVSDDEIECLGSALVDARSRRLAAS